MTAILARIGAASRAGGRAESPRTYRRAGALAPEQRVELFVERVGEYRADVRRVAEAEARQRSTSSAASAASARWSCRRACRLRGAREAPSSSPTTRSPPAELDAVDGVLTGCTVAIAETGTIVLTGGRARAAARSRSCPTCTSAWSRRARSSSSCPRRLAMLGGCAGRAPSDDARSRARRRRRTSSSTASRASTARARSSSS